MYLSTCQDTNFFPFTKNDLRVVSGKFTGQLPPVFRKKWSVICSDHFSTDDLNYLNRASKRLRPGTIPSSNPQSSA